MKESMMAYGEFIIIEQMEEKKMTDGGLYLPDTSTEKPTIGKVLSIGRGKILESMKILEPINLSIGDIVFFVKYAGSEIEYQGKKFIVLREGDIMGKIVKTEQ